MGSYSPERKAAVIARMLPAHNQSIYQLSRQEDIPVNTHNIAFYMTDAWPVYQALLASTSHVISKKYTQWICKHTRFSSTHFLRLPCFQLSAGTLPASGCSAIREDVRCYIPSASAL